MGLNIKTYNLTGSIGPLGLITAGRILLVG